MEEPTIFEDENGIKTITEYRLNENGQKVKITRKVKRVLTKHKAKHAEAERKLWKKFGSASGEKASFDDGITALGEEVFLKLQVSKNHDVEEQQLTVAEQVKKMQTSKIICRVCKGDHWTTKCPYKDTLQPLEEILDQSRVDGPGGASGAASPAPTADAGGASSRFGGSKYVPPSMRGKPTSAESMPPSGRRSATEDTATVRVTNLSEDTEEADLQALFRRFGAISRIFLSRDKETGLCKGFAFVNYYSKEDGQKAIDTMHGYGFDNLILNVEWAK